MYRPPRVEPAHYRRLELRAHQLLGDVPLHDVWRFDLEGDRTIGVSDVLEYFATVAADGAGAAARSLFMIRAKVGGWLGWDRADPARATESYVHRLTEADRARSVDEPGSQRGFWTSVYTFEHEAVGEVINRTVHAFLVFALEPAPNGHTMYWAIHVKPVNQFTRLYMMVIDPFRRWLIYPGVIRRFEENWRRRSTRK